ncbi:MAG: prolipoprotein diacylglyceryl transferase [Bdellovibrionales bacterium]|nr:prolipoprotein diacylglyceryl transferase [Bdellovibrionales bacterium]
MESHPSYYVHDIDPFAIQFPDSWVHYLGNFPDGLGIRWYGLAYLAGFILGLWLVRMMIRKGTTPLTENQLFDFVTYVAIGVLAGGRIGYCIFYSPDLITEFGGAFPYWGVLKVHQGGMASHGGMLGVMLAVFIFARKHKFPFWHLLDLTVFGGALGFFFGRIANFINGELYGREIHSHVPWAVQFPNEMYLWGQDKLSRIVELGPAVEKLGEVKTAYGETLKFSSDTWKGLVSNYRTDMGSRRAVEVIIEKLIKATQSGNEAVREALSHVLTPRHPSQLYQSFLEGLLVFLILAFIWRKPRKPGVIASCFGIFYCIARIIGEEFRMPDAQIGFQALGLTRGQWLSIALMLVAIVVLFIKQRSTKYPPMGGFSKLSTDGR